MKTTKLLKRIGAMLSQSPEATKRRQLHKTIKELKRKQKDLEDRLKDADGKQERRHIQQKIDILRAQRRKGAALYKELKSQGD